MERVLGVVAVLRDENGRPLLGVVAALGARSDHALEERVGDVAPVGNRA